GGAPPCPVVAGWLGGKYPATTGGYAPQPEVLDCSADWKLLLAVSTPLPICCSAWFSEVDTRFQSCCTLKYASLEAPSQVDDSWFTCDCRSSNIACRRLKVLRICCTPASIAP